MLSSASRADRQSELQVVDEVKNGLGKVSELKQVRLRVRLPKSGEIEQFDRSSKIAVNS